MELGPARVRVNAVAPGLVRTGFSVAVTADPERLAAVERENPLQRFATPDEVAEAVLCLASSAAAYLNAAVLALDGRPRPAWVSGCRRPTSRTSR